MTAPIGHGRAWPPRSSTARGIALVIVLWMLALLTVIANSAAFSLRSEVQTSANRVNAARAEAAADAGVFRAIQELARPATDPNRWRGNGLMHEWAFDDVVLHVTIVDEAARIDLNAAPDVLLSSMFRSVGVDEADALSLADAVIDWRDPDNVRRLHGAEQEDYLAAGKDYGPRNGNFETIEELRLVLGMNDEIFRRVAPMVTVHSTRAWVAGTIAARSVLLALPGATPDQVDNYLALRQMQLQQGAPVANPPFAPSLPSQPLGDTFTVQVEAFLGDNVIFLREAVVSITGNPREPAVILAWRTLDRDQRVPTPNVTD